LAPLDLPHAHTLLCAIYTFAQLADHVAMAKDETIRLAHVDICVDVAVEEHIADIDGVQVQVECGSECCCGANRRQWSRWCLCLEIVDTWTLRESVGLVSPARSHDSGTDLVLSCDPF